MRETAQRFSEEDLTRYLQLTLELFKDLQASLQPRLHLEIGLLRLVHAGRLVPIEQALGSMKVPSTAEIACCCASLRSRRSREPVHHRLHWTHRGKPLFLRQPKASGPATAVAAAPAQDLKSALYDALSDLGCNFTADAVEASEVSEAGGELVFVTPVEFKLAMSDSDLKKAALAGAWKAPIESR